MTDKDDIKAQLAAVDALDTRSRAQKIGDIGGGKRAVVTLSAGLTDGSILKNDLNAAEKAVRLRAKRLIGDHVESIILNMINNALNAPKISDQIDASKQLMQQFLGRPSTVHVGGEGQSVVPNITISFGDPKQPEIIDTTNYDFAEVEDDE